MRHHRNVVLGENAIVHGRLQRKRARSISDRSFISAFDDREVAPSARRSRRLPETRWKRETRSVHVARAYTYTHVHVEAVVLVTHIRNRDARALACTATAPRERSSAARRAGARDARKRVSPDIPSAKDDPNARRGNTLVHPGPSHVSGEDFGKRRREVRSSAAGAARRTCYSADAGSIARKCARARSRVVIMRLIRDVTILADAVFF